MWLLILEAALALGLIVFIMWWTLAPVKKREDASAADAAPARTSAARDKASNTSDN